MIQLRCLFKRLVALIALCNVCSRALLLLADEKEPASLSEFFRVSFNVMMGRDNHKEEHLQEPLKVIAAGLPRTGTASFVAALNKVGLHTYHMKDGAIETPGHLDLWYNYYVTKTVALDEILDDMSARGFNASSDSPTCFWYREQMERYPDAKVVLTVRGDGSGEAWQASFGSAIIDAMVILQEIPFRWFSMFRKIDEFARAMFVQGLKGTDTDPATGFPVKDQLPAAYNQWVEQVRATVPQEKLLVHAAKDGWKPLCDFLSPLSPDIASKCDSILASGEPYPHINDKAQVRAMLVGLYGISTFCKLSPVLGAVAVILVQLGKLRRNQRGLKSVKSE